MARICSLRKYSLLAIHACLRFGGDLLPQVEHVEPHLNHYRQAAQSLDRIEDFQQLLPLLEVNSGENAIRSASQPGSSTLRTIVRTSSGTLGSMLM